MASNGRKNAELVALELAAGRTAGEAAKAGQVSERTVYRWLEDADFRGEVRRLRREMVERALAGLADAAVSAVATLRGLLGANSETARLGAARTILELGVKLRESVELEERIAALEGAADRRNGGRP